MDVNMNAEAKVYGVPVAPTTVEKEDRAKPSVQPVQQSGNSSQSALDEKILKKHQTQEELTKNINVIQQRLDSIGANVKLGLGTDQKTDTIVARITEKKTGNLIKQIPPEEVLTLRAKIEELTGILFDEKA